MICLQAMPVWAFNNGRYGKESDPAKGGVLRGVLRGVILQERLSGLSHCFLGHVAPHGSRPLGKHSFLYPQSAKYNYRVSYSERVRYALEVVKLPKKIVHHRYYVLSIGPIY